jgi:hypothetical protein
MGLYPPGHLGDSRAMRLAVERCVQEGGVPAWREEGFGLEVPCLGREKERLSGGNDSAQTKVRVQECPAHQVCAVKSWVGA